MRSQPAVTVRVVATAVAVAIGGLAIGFLPWAVADPPTHGLDWGNELLGVTVVGTGSFLLALTLAAVLTLIDGLQSSTRVWVPFAVVVPTILAGLAVGEAAYVSTGIDLGTIAAMTVVLLVIVALGVAVGCRVPRSTR